MTIAAALKWDQDGNKGLACPDPLYGFRWQGVRATRRFDTSIHLLASHSYQKRVRGALVTGI